MEQCLHIGPPDPGSKREREFNESLKNMKDIVLKVVNNRRNGVDTNEIPFIDALLQTQVPDEQVCNASNLDVYIIRYYEFYITKCQICCRDGRL